MGADSSSATLGGRIRQARIAAGYDKGEHFARRMQIAAAQLSKYELDHVEPRAERIAAIAAVCGVTSDWLITGTGSGPSVPSEAAE